MDRARFDTLTRSLAENPTRRGALATLLGATLGLLGRAETLAKKGKGHRKKKRKRRLRPAPTCSDGIQNGSETGVDCGGPCSRCATGQGCVTANDCASAFCSSGTCQTCTVSPNNCGSDANGECVCLQKASDGSPVCAKNYGTGGGPCPNNAPCPAGTMCMNVVGMFDCWRPCGAP